MESTSVEVAVFRRRQVALLLAALVAVAGGIWSMHDALLLAALVAAAGLIWSSREWRAWLLAALIVAVGLLWSSVEDRGCSAWWRGRILYEKLAGHLPYIGWHDLSRTVLWPCSTMRRPDEKAADRLELLEQKLVDGRKWGLYRTDLGKFWTTPPDNYLLSWLVWEMTVQVDYESGDVVIDCGAHVGVFCRYALRRGAGRVIAIEPDPTNLACLEANLAQEIAAGQVIVVKAGVWDRKTRLPLFHFEENSGQNSFLWESPNASKIEGVPVRPLDEIVEELKLDQVDFIKMDIEGAERRALQGARQTITRFKPRMAISSYHLRDDPIVIPAIVRETQPGYQIHAKDVEILGSRRVTIKVLFFQ